MLTLPLRPELEGNLHAIAVKQGKSDAELTVELIERFIENQGAISARMDLGHRWTLEDAEREFGMGV